MAHDRPVSMKTKEYRKVVKPLLERRRRARINGCLNELRNFILETTKQDSVQASKLEKADILEMTVHYLRLLLRQQCTMSSQTNATDLSRFRAGFTECAHEVSLFVANMATVNPNVRARLLTHLSKCLGQLEGVETMPKATGPPQSPPPYTVRMPVGTYHPPAAAQQQAYPINLYPAETVPSPNRTQEWPTRHDEESASVERTPKAVPSSSSTVAPNKQSCSTQQQHGTILLTVMDHQQQSSSVWRPW